MLKSLQTLAGDADPQSRAALCERVVNIYFSHEQEPTEIEQNLFGDLTIRLMQDMASEICGRVAKRVAESHRTPHELAISLAKSEDEEIYAPILQHSPVLTDDDLVDIATGQTEGHRLSIAGRSEINESVTDALVHSGELSVLRKVTANEGAKFTDEGLSIVVERSGSDEVLLKTLSKRGQVEVGAKPTEFFTQLKSVIATSLGDLADTADLDQEFDPSKIELHLNHLLKVRMADRNRAIHVKALAQEIFEGKRTTDKVLSDHTGAEHIRDAVLLIAQLLKIPDAAVKSAYVNSDSSAFAMLCHALKVSPETYFQLMVTRFERLNIDEVHLPELMKNYKRLTERESMRLVRIIKANSHS